jgi:hypothetical protein
MARDADWRAHRQAGLQHEARREFVRIKDCHDAALGKASALFAELSRAVAELRFAPAEKERQFWAAIDDAVEVAAGMYDGAASWGLDWVSESEQADVSRLLQSASGELSAAHRASITGRLTRLWDAWPAGVLARLGRQRPEVAALNLRNLATVALSLMKAGLAEPGGDNLFEVLSACLSEHLGVPSFVLPEARGRGERPILVSSLIDPRLAAAWVIKEAAAELVPPAPGLETLPATLQALCLSQEGLFGDAALMALIFAENAAIVGLHHEWKKLTHVLPDARERARHTADLAAASPAAQAQFGV